MRATPLHERRTAVYRLLAEDGAPLYVGASCNPDSRLADHRTDKPWWQEVASVSVEWHPDRLSALRHEAQTIANESPRYNRTALDPERIALPAVRDEPRDSAGRSWPEAMRAAGIRRPRGIPDEATENAAIHAWLRWKQEAGVA